MPNNTIKTAEQILKSIPNSRAEAKSFWKKLLFKGEDREGQLSRLYEQSYNLLRQFNEQFGSTPSANKSKAVEAKRVKQKSKAKSQGTKRHFVVDEKSKTSILEHLQNMPKKRKLLGVHF